MRLSFNETMRGTLGNHPVEFSVTARAEGRGHFALSGTVSALPWAQGLVKGSLHISLLGFHRFIRYRLELPHGYRLEAEKSPSLLRPVHSMTHMPVLLRSSDGQVVARGSMEFSLRELPSFLASMLGAS